MTFSFRYLAAAIAAIAIVIAGFGATVAQQPPAGGNQCQSAAHLLVVTGRVYPPPSPDKQLQVLLFPRSTYGDKYLVFLRNSTATPPPATAGSASDFARRLADLQNQGNDQLDLEQHLKDVYATMYGTTADATGHFVCGGLPSGYYHILSIAQPKPTTLATTSAGSINAQASAAAAAMANGSSPNNGINAQAAAQAAAMAAQIAQSKTSSGVNTTSSQYQYSSVTVPALNPLATSSPQPVSAKRFRPISSYTSSY